MVVDDGIKNFYVKLHESTCLSVKDHLIYLKLIG